MAKINKMYYYTAKREKKLNCYYVNLPKALVEKTGLQYKEIQLKQVGNKIIIEAKVDKN